jgi:hypothetical protein
MGVPRQSRGLPYFVIYLTDKTFVFVGVLQRLAPFSQFEFGVLHEAAAPKGGGFDPDPVGDTARAGSLTQLLGANGDRPVHPSVSTMYHTVIREGSRTIEGVAELARRRHPCGWVTSSTIELRPRVACPKGTARYRVGSRSLLVVPGYRVARLDR